jgi:hypothetical protein
LLLEHEDKFDAVVSTEVIEPGDSATEGSRYAYHGYLKNRALLDALVARPSRTGRA